MSASGGPVDEPPEDDLGVLLLQGHDMVQQTGQAHAARWGLGTAERWDLDQASGLLRFTFADHSAEARVQVLGSFSPAGGTWLWSWANSSLAPELCRASEAVQAWGEQHEAPMLTTPRLEVDAEQAADVTALGFRLSGSTGFYRAPAGSSHLYLVFGPVTITTADGRRETFTIGLE